MKSLARPLIALATAAMLPLAACTNSNEDTTEQSSTSETSSQSTATTSSSESKEEKEKEGVAEAKEAFGTLAPESVFEDFDSCEPAGVKNAMDCSGPNVGQFQFSRSESKAASMTQLLTELRSARVVKDTGRAVVGWNTLGSTAVITVVDNEEGTVLQQMTSTDQKDPEERIEELDLLQAPAVVESEKKQAASSEASSSAATESEEADAQDQNDGDDQNDTASDS
ncbi:hypothetical protein [Corynebacterium pseudopelargi]|uniref:Beta-N-acetylhexosaminidase n=1 Tax=Corynebacterium pseudopelargi TaxID=2080757 RepID=A0A3G6J0B7_9CORY|nr:hypothetical protein [Corynebacterium pseudopelargi]AZA09790.1 hypothetical protein CPPEL_08435 [Corynebacterium pseudopelargi]